MAPINDTYVISVPNHFLTNAFFFGLAIMSVKNTLCAGFTPSHAPFAAAAASLFTADQIYDAFCTPSCPILRHDVKIFSSPSPSGIAIALRPIASPLFVPRFAARNTPAAFLLCGFPPAGRVVRTVTTPFLLFSLLLLFVFKVLLPNVVSKKKKKNVIRFCGQIRSETQKEISKIQNPKL